MDYDTRFALIDKDGDERFPAIINGTYQVGKSVSAKPIDLTKFAHAILVDHQEGRFRTTNRSKHGTMKYLGRYAVGYRLDPDIAKLIGVLPQGTR